MPRSCGWTGTPASANGPSWRWGLIPSWAKDPSIGNRLINARGETVATKPAFRVAFRQRRCLVVADGYYEWKKQGRQKQPYYIHLQDGQPVAMAGLWERWQPNGGEAIQPRETFTIITRSANEQTRDIHDRMPALLAEEDYGAWLDPKVKDSQQLMALLNPVESPTLVADPVSTFVNSPRNDDPRCIEPMTPLV